MQEYCTAMERSSDALVWNVSPRDARFFRRNEHASINSEDTSLSSLFRRSIDFPSLQYINALVALGAGTGAMLEVVGQKTKLQGLKNVGRLLMGTGGLYALASYARYGREHLSIREIEQQSVALPPSLIDATLVPSTPNIQEPLSFPHAPESIPTATFFPTPTPNIFEHYGLEASSIDGVPYARYLIKNEQGQIIEGYTQGVQAGDDGVMRYILSPDTLPTTEGWPQYGQVFGAWPIIPTGTRMGIDVYCSNLCVMHLVDAKEQKILHTYSAIPVQSEDSVKKYRVYTELPSVNGNDTWIVIEPSNPGSLEPLHQIHIAYGQLEEPEILLPHHVDPYIGVSYDMPTISGITHLEYSEEEQRMHEHQAHIAVGKLVGRASQWWHDVQTTSDGWKQIEIPIHRSVLGIPDEDAIRAKIVAPMDLVPGWHDVKIACDDHCEVSFVTPYGVVLDTISYDLTDPKDGEYRDEFGYLHRSIYLGTGTKWIVISHEDAYGGAGVDVQIRP